MNFTRRQTLLLVSIAVLAAVSVFISVQAFASGSYLIAALGLWTVVAWGVIARWILHYTSEQQDVLELDGLTICPACRSGVLHPLGPDTLYCARCTSEVIGIPEQCGECGSAVVIHRDGPAMCANCLRKVETVAV